VEFGILYRIFTRFLIILLLFPAPIIGARNAVDIGTDVTTGLDSKPKF